MMPDIITCVVMINNSLTRSIGIQYKITKSGCAGQKKLSTLTPVRDRFIYVDTGQSPAPEL
jgi:hypothetical protein